MMTGCGTRLPTRSTTSRIRCIVVGCAGHLSHRAPLIRRRPAVEPSAPGLSSRARRRMRAQERMPRRKLSSSYFSLGLWMRSSSSAKPASTTSMPSAFFSSWVTGIEPPPPMKTASRPHSAVSASRVLPKAGASIGKRMALPAPCSMNSTLQSAGSARAHEVAEGRADRVRVLVEHQAERDLGRGLGRDHRLEALALIAAAHAVDLAGRPRPGHLEHASGRARPRAPRGRPRPGTRSGRNGSSSHCARSAAGSSGTPS